ncbi:MAG: sugar nucleotide-binding protein, partial [Bacteroidales bacterium]
LYSAHGKNFVKTIKKLSTERESINVVSDQLGTPTYAADLAGAIMEIITKTERGLIPFTGGTYHFSNEGSCSWYQFACEIKELLGLRLEINPVSTSEYMLPATRPAMSVLDISKIKKQYKLKIPGWKESLAVCVSKLKSMNDGS